jgi:transketolase
MGNMNKESILHNKADQIRREVIEVAVANQAGHIAPSLSCVDILVALYYDVMRYEPQNPLWEERDRLIFSKSHGCYALYSILADLGMIPAKLWRDFYKDRDGLWGCAERKPEYGLEAGCGSLGHGLPMAVGLAFGARLQNQSVHTFCIVGDGELQEGTCWEAIQFAVKHRVDNLTIIVDHNRLQAMDFIVNIMDQTDTDLLNRLEGFGLSPQVCPGHDVVKLAEQIRESKANRQNIPNLIVAQTVKGYGLQCMENVPKFHFRIPTEDELRISNKTFLLSP